jgi:hypothetical protein
MELIDQLEPTRRGVYGGTVGYLDLAGDMDMAIAIRTAVIAEGVASVQAGAGIVADSVPATEYVECRNKAAAALRAVQLASRLGRAVTRVGAVVALLVAGAVALALSAAAWVSGTAPTPTGDATVVVSGATAAPAATAAGLVLLAAALTLTIAGSAVGRLAAGAAALTSAGAVAQVATVLLDPARPVQTAAAAATGVPALRGDAVALAPAWAAGASSSSAPWRRRWGARRSAVATRPVRFDRTPGTAPATDARTRAMDDWDALGRGEDPTEGTGTLDPRRNT